MISLFVLLFFPLKYISTHLPFPFLFAISKSHRLWYRILANHNKSPCHRYHISKNSNHWLQYHILIDCNKSLHCQYHVSQNYDCCDKVSPTDCDIISHSFTDCDITKSSADITYCKILCQFSYPSPIILFLTDYDICSACQLW